MEKNIVFLSPVACETLYAALGAIQARCDGANELDGEGFSKLDVQPAALLLGSHPSVWTDEERLRAATFGHKYRKQAASIGHDLSSILTDSIVKEVSRIHTVRRAQRAKVEKGQIRFAKDGRIVLETPYSDELLQELRALDATTLEELWRVHVRGVQKTLAAAGYGDTSA